MYSTASELYGGGVRAYAVIMFWISRGSQPILVTVAVSSIVFAISLSGQSKSSTQGDAFQLHAPWVSCYDKTGEQFIGSKEQRTPVLISPNQAYRAYAEIQARSVAVGQCENRAELFISVQGSPFKSVFTQAASQQNGAATSLGPVAWSPNSRWLVVERGLWFYGSDAGGNGVLLYDTQSGKVTTPEIEIAIQNRLGKRCVLRYGITGFDAQNRVKLQVADWIDELDGPLSDCIHGEAEWLLDPITLTALASQ
jgi:hypothetical protein